MPDLSLLLPLTGLRSLDIKLGGTRDLGLLPRVGELWYLELWMIRGLTDVSAVGDIRSLRALFLQALRQVEMLPDLSRATSLRRVRLEGMKGLRDVGPLATAPALEAIELIDMRHLQPNDLAPLAGLPNLKAVTPGLEAAAGTTPPRPCWPSAGARTFDWAADAALLDPTRD